MWYLIIDHWSVKWGSGTAVGPSANIPLSFTRKVSCIWIENVAMLTLWLLLTFISLVIFPSHIFFSSCNVFSQRCPLLLYSAACGACGFQKCHRFQEVAWNWQSRQNSCCRISPWQASSGALSCSLCIETLSWSKLYSLADCLSDHGNLGQTTLRSLPWDVSHYGQEPRPKGVLWAVKMFNSPPKD